MSLLTGHGVTTNNPVLGHTTIAPRVATSKLIFCTIPTLNPPQTISSPERTRATGELGMAQERSERGVGYHAFKDRRGSTELEIPAPITVFKVRQPDYEDET